MATYHHYVHYTHQYHTPVHHEHVNKLVVEARLKGAGMHWQRHNVNPMLVLRNAICNDRWDEMWKASMMQRQCTRQKLRDERTQARCEQAVARFLKLLLWYRPPTRRLPVEPVPHPVSHPTSSLAEVAPGPHRPAANHLWRWSIVVQHNQPVLAKI